MVPSTVSAHEIPPAMDVWPRCLQRLEAELPQEDVRTWLKPLQADRRERQLVLYAPNAFVMEEVRSQYLPRILDVGLAIERILGAR